MRNYIFSIFARGFIAVSGFFVFLVSASLFGAEGRGVISYGTSLLAFLGLVFSFNLGRTFLSETVQDENLKRERLADYLILNVISVGLTCLAAICWWFFANSTQTILEFKVLLSLMLISIFYVWSINSNSIYAAFQVTHIQEKIITLTRLILCLLLTGFYFFKFKEISVFLFLYSFILAMGCVFEIWYLIRTYKIVFRIPNFSIFIPYIKKSIWPHLDYLAFNLFPIILILISGNFLSKSQIGQINFVLQFVNVIFLLSTVANIRVSSYVSVMGFQAKKSKIIQLFLATLAISLLGSGFMYIVLKFITSLHRFSSFDETSSLFIYTIWAIPGCVLYQFITPIWLEYKVIKKAAILNIITLVVVISISYNWLTLREAKHVIYIYSFFYTLVFFNQFLLLKMFDPMRKEKCQNAVEA